MMLLLTNVNQILFCRFYSGNALATPLGAVAAQGGTKGELIQTCRLLEMLALHFLASHGWPFSLRIGFQS